MQHPKKQRYEDLFDGKNLSLKFEEYFEISSISGSCDVSVSIIDGGKVGQTRRIGHDCRLLTKSCEVWHFRAASNIW